MDSNRANAAFYHALIRYLRSHRHVKGLAIDEDRTK